MDLLCADVGELCGGTLREERHDYIMDKVHDDLDWSVTTRTKYKTLLRRLLGYIGF